MNQMTVREMFELAEKIADCNEYDCIGIRFEDKDREIGEICEFSKDNSSRDDERDFPEYGSEEYENLPFMDGTSAYKISALKNFTMLSNMDKPVEKYFWNTKHGYLIASNYGHSGDDEGEIVIEDAEVIVKFF